MESANTIGRKIHPFRLIKRKLKKIPSPPFFFVSRDENTLREREEKNRQTWLTIRTRQRYQRPNERNNILFHTDIAILRYPLINYVTTLRKFDQLAPRIYLLLRTFNLFLRERRSINIAASTASLNLNRINILTVSTTDRNTIYHRREIGPNTGWDRIYHARYRAN